MSESKLLNIGNSNITVEIGKGDGLIRGLFAPLGDYNLADKKGFGGVRYTLKGDDIKTDVAFTAYNDRLASYDSTEITENGALCENKALRFHTLFKLENDVLRIDSFAENGDISQFGIDLNYNYLGKKNLILLIFFI